MYKTSPYLIRNLTNLHAGSGDTNYGIVDKQIQRDTASRLPIAHASSIKGAIRDHMTHRLEKPNEETGKMELSNNAKFKLRAIFGAEESAKKENDQENQTPDKLDHLPKQGLVTFFDARMLFVPMRSDKRPFYHVTSAATLNDARDWLETLGIKNLWPEISQSRSVVYDQEKAMVEEVECATATADEKIEKIKAFFGIQHLAIFGDEDFSQLLESLPVIARNKLNNGQSVNLWYEEVLPRQSILLTALSEYALFDKGDREDFEKAFKKLHETLEKDLIQIGANASIGYGLCRFERKGEER
ncbi:type III-B CRISPR module RAMP protein Cmr4 [Hydrogenimonas sp.]